MATGLTTSILNTFKDKGIKDICPYQYEKDGDNHCAHLIGHILGLTIGEKCAMQTVDPDLRTKYSVTGVSIRVHEIFNHIGGGVKIDVAAATAASAAATPIMTTTSSGAAAVSTSSGGFVLPTLTTTTGGAAAVSPAPSGVPPAECLIYALLGDRVKNGVMEDQPYEHIGIYFGSLVWHYSNSKDKVITQTLAEFSKHYDYKGTTVLYYTDFPTGALAVEFATASVSALPVNSYTETTGTHGNPFLKRNPKYKPKATPTPTPTPSPFATPTPTPTASPFATPTPFATPGFKR
jgi:hypothetical protein